MTAIAKPPNRRIPSVNGLSSRGIDLASLEELRSLWEQEKDGLPNGIGKITRLFVKNIQLAEGVFQPRFTSDEGLERDLFNGHVLELHERLTQDYDLAQTGGGFSAITVFPVAGVWYCLDGHARVHAYLKAGWDDRLVAVRPFRGTFNEALAESVSLNSDLKLPMTQKERSEAAWRLVLASSELSNRALGRVAGVSHTLVGKMRDVAKNGLRSHPSIDARQLSWSVCAYAHKGGSLNDAEQENWKEMKRQKLIRTLQRHASKSLSDPEMLASAVVEAFPNLRDCLLAELNRPVPVEGEELDF